MSALKSRPTKRSLWQRTGFWVFFLMVIAAGGGAAWYFLAGPGVSQLKPAAKTGPDYNTTTVRRGNIQISASGSANLIASQTVDLSFSTKGTLTELDVKNGDTVKTGQVLARLGNAQSLEASLAAAKLQLLQSQQALTDLQTKSNSSLAQAYQNLVKAQGTYDTSVNTQDRTAYARCSKQVNTKYAAALDKAKAALDRMNPSDYGSDAYVNLKNNYDQALANYNYCITYTPDEKSNAQASVEVAKVALQQAQDTYNTLKNASGIDPNQLALNEAKVNQAQTQLAQAQKDLEGIVLTAPIDGKVVFVAANQGAIVDTTKFITIADMSHPTVEISLDETDLDKLVIGSKTQITFDALPEQVFNGTVTQVEPQLVTSGNTQVARGYAELDETGAKAVQNLPLGLNASVVVINKEATNVLIVPKEALRDLGNSDYAVFVVGQNGNLQLKPVKVGLTDSTRAEISSGLNEGDLVSTGAAQVK